MNEMNAKTLVSAAVALVAGLAVGYLLPSSSESAPAAAADKDAAQPKQIAEVDLAPAPAACKEIFDKFGICAHKKRGPEGPLLSASAERCIFRVFIPYKADPGLSLIEDDFLVLIVGIQISGLCI